MYLFSITCIELHVTRNNKAAKICDIDLARGDFDLAYIQMLQFFFFVFCLPFIVTSFPD
jgi:hypothetical protein